MNCLCGILQLCAGCRLSQWTGTRRLNPVDGLALLEAAETGDEGTVRELLERGVPADGPRTRRLETALFLAVENDHPDVVRTLLEHGADPSVPNGDGAGAITLAAAAGNVPIIELMRDFRSDKFHEPAAVLALHDASLCGKPEALQALLDGGAPVDVRLPKYPPVLHSAAAACAFCVEKLLDAGADPNCIDHLLCTPLHVAARAGKFDCVHMLMKAGAHVDKLSVDNRLPWQESRNDRMRDLMLDYFQKQRSSLVGDTSPLHQPSQDDGSQSSPFAQSKEELSSEHTGEETELQTVRRLVSAGPSDPASPGTSPSSNDALATADSQPSGESLPETSSSTVAELSGATFQGTSSQPSAKFSSKEHSD